MEERKENSGIEIFDAHIHLYPDAIAPACVPMLASRFGNAAAFDGTVTGARRYAAEKGLKAMLNLPVATKPAQVESINGWAAAINAEADTIYSLGTIHPDCNDCAAIIKHIADTGLRGIKMHPEYQQFTIDDVRMRPIYETCSETGMVLYLHAGGERVFDAPFRSSPQTIAQLIDAYPDLTVVAAHLGGFSMWEESERFLIGKRIYLDLSHCFNWVDTDERIVRMIRAHGVERIVFGSDGPWQDPKEIANRFLAQPFTRDEQKAILHDNAMRLFR